MYIKSSWCTLTILQLSYQGYSPCFFTFLLAVTVSQFFLVLDDFDNFEVYWTGVCLMFLLWLDWGYGFWGSKSQRYSASLITFYQGYILSTHDCEDCDALEGYCPSIIGSCYGAPADGYSAGTLPSVAWFWFFNRNQKSQCLYEIFDF